MRSYTVKENHIVTAVSEILWDTHTDIDPVTFIYGLILLIMLRIKTNNSYLKLFTIPAIVAQHLAHLLVVGKVIGSNIGPTLHHN